MTSSTSPTFSPFNWAGSVTAIVCSSPSAVFPVSNGGALLTAVIVARTVRAAMEDVPNVAQVDAPIYNADTPEEATLAIINAYSVYAPQDEKTDDIVSTLRDDTIPQTLQGTDARAYVSGLSESFDVNVWPGKILLRVSMDEKLTSSAPA